MPKITSELRAEPLAFYPEGTLADGPVQEWPDSGGEVGADGNPPLSDTIYPACFGIKRCVRRQAYDVTGGMRVFAPVLLRTGAFFLLWAFFSKSL